MRMRFKPYARPELLACDFHVHEPLTHGGHWHETYARPDQQFGAGIGFKTHSHGSVSCSSHV